jgi:hypothetical protein
MTPAEPIKDPDAAHPIPDGWRPTLAAIVGALVVDDFGLSQRIAGVTPVSPELAARMRRYVADYGATLARLPEESWQTSCCQWTIGHWDALVDLWTDEEGRSDLVLFLRVVDTSEGPQFTVESLHVP